MEYLKIKCGRCDNSFNLYSDAFRKQVTLVHCPYCSQQMDHDQWERLVDAANTFAEVNKRFRKRHEERGKALFQAELRTAKNYVNSADVVKNWEADR